MLDNSDSWNGKIQSPTCFRQNINCSLFSMKASCGDSPLVLGRAHNEKTIAIKLGLCCDIKVGTKLDIYENNLLESLGISLGTLEVCNARDSITVLGHVAGLPSFHVPEEFLVRLRV